MFKKVLFACSLIALSCTSAQAAFYTGINLGLTNNSSQNGNYRGLAPIVTVGYGDMVSSCSYIAAEAFGTLGNLMLSDNTPIGTSLRSTYTMGASFIPGYLITDNVIGFLRLGVVNTKFSSANTTQAGGQGGIGLQTALTEEWHLRAEYDYSAYSGNSSIGAVKTDQFLLGFMYNFI